MMVPLAEDFSLIAWYIAVLVFLEGLLRQTTPWCSP